MAAFPEVTIISQPAMQWEASNAGTIVADQLLANPDIDLIFNHAAHLSVAAVASLEVGRQEAGRHLRDELERRPRRPRSDPQGLAAGRSRAAALRPGCRRRHVHGQDRRQGGNQARRIRRASASPAPSPSKPGAPTSSLPGAAITPANVDDPKFWGNLKPPTDTIKSVE